MEIMKSNCEYKSLKSCGGLSVMRGLCTERLNARRGRVRLRFAVWCQSGCVVRREQRMGALPEAVRPNISEGTHAVWIGFEASSLVPISSGQAVAWPGGIRYFL